MVEGGFGHLYVVATPIGNLADVSSRALDTLKTVGLIAAEDTRHTSRLLQHYQITTPMVSLNAHNEGNKVQLLIDKLLYGAHIAIVSDAGTPLISDPGFPLVRACYQHGITVIPIPGPCAAIAALSAAGLPTTHFTFEGFLPAKSKQRQATLAKLITETRTMVFYEAKYRIIDCLVDCVEIFGTERLAVIARELTKSHETIIQASLGELLARIQTDPEQQRGEYVLIIMGASKVQTKTEAYEREVLTALITELPLSQAVKIAVKLTGGQRKHLYQLALTLQHHLEKSE